MTVYIANAFSLNMLAVHDSSESRVSASVQVVPISNPKFHLHLALAGGDGDVVSAIGHEATAAVASAVLGIPVPPNRVAIKLAEGDTLYVLQPLQRLEEGKVLSEAELRKIPCAWFSVRVHYYTQHHDPEASIGWFSGRE